MKILHLIPALKFFRVYQSFKEIPGVEQMIIGPTEVAEPAFHYGYSDFGIKNIHTLKLNAVALNNCIFLNMCD